MKGKVLLISGVSCALMFGPSALGAQMKDNDGRGGATWSPERGVTQTLSTPRYHSRSYEGDRYQSSPERFRKDYEDYPGEYERYQQEQGRFENDRRQFNGVDRTPYRSRNRNYATTVLGTLIRVKGDSYMVNLINGDRRPLHVDETTLLEAGLERGDRLIARVRPDGHAISIIKDRGRLGEHFVTPEVPEGGYDYPDQRERYGKNYQYDNGNRYRN